MQLIERTTLGRTAPERFDATFAAMHRDRKRVFVDGLGWDVPVVAGEYEVDQFDDEHATYLLIAEGGARPAHLGSVRLLPTQRPHILGDIFPELAMHDAPRGPEVVEITRLCISPDVGGVRAGMAVRRKLAVALTEWALLHGVETYTLVCLASHLPQLLAIGWDVEPLGLPVDIAGQRLVGAAIAVTPATLSLLRATTAARPAPEPLRLAA